MNWPKSCAIVGRAVATTVWSRADRNSASMAPITIVRISALEKFMGRDKGPKPVFETWLFGPLGIFRQVA